MNYVSYSLRKGRRVAPAAFASGVRFAPPKSITSSWTIEQSIKSSCTINHKSITQVSSKSANQDLPDKCIEELGNGEDSVSQQLQPEGEVKLVL